MNIEQIIDMKISLNNVWFSLDNLECNIENEHVQDVIDSSNSRVFNVMGKIDKEIHSYFNICMDNFNSEDEYYYFMDDLMSGKYNARQVILRLGNMSSRKFSK